MDSHAWDKRYREKELVWSAGPNRFLVEAVVGLAPGRAIDVACGEGRNALWLAEQGWQVRAIDYSPVAIAKARARAAELGLDVEARVQDATDPWDGEYDLVIVFYLHLPRDQNASCLRQAAQALSPGGTLLYVGHDQRNLVEGLGGPQDASILYGPEEISALVPELHLERAETVRRPVEKDGRVRDALDVYVRARKMRIEP